MVASSVRNVHIRPAREQDDEALIPLVAAFRAELDAYAGAEHPPQMDAAREILTDYRRRNYPIFVAELDGRLVGFLVCRVDEGVVWAEALYVDPAYRRQGIGSRLYDQAEALAQAHGEPTVYNWVHPNNQAILAFLARRGYRVLNLIEIRRPLPGETLAGQVTVGPHTLAYPVPIQKEQAARSRKVET